MEDKKYSRVCPSCNKIIFYSTKRSRDNSEKNNRKCVKCGSGWMKGLTKDTSDILKKMGEKVSKKHKEKFINGYKTWNTGLSKETSEIIKRNSENHIGYKHTEESKLKISNASKKHWENLEYRNLVISKVKDKIIELTPQWISKMEELGYFTPKSLKSDWENYKNKVRLLTEKNDLSKLENYKKRGRSNYHLDHKFSITAGFIHNIDPKIISHISNLEFIKCGENTKKYTKCSITKEELLENYKNYDKKN
jgi:hypothetical protein